MGEYENRYSTLTGVVFHSVGTNQTPLMAEPISITTSNTFSEEDWNSVIDRFYIPQGDRQPIKIAFSEPYIVGVDMANTGGSVIQRIETPYIVPNYYGQFTFDKADIVHEDDEDCGDCAELNEFLDSLQKKCDEAV